MTDRQTHRQTDASDLIIYPMLCYVNLGQIIKNNPNWPSHFTPLPVRPCLRGRFFTILACGVISPT